jgi:hypothetical protein
MQNEVFRIQAMQAGKVPMMAAFRILRSAFGVFAVSATCLA